MEPSSTVSDNPHRLMQTYHTITLSQYHSIIQYTLPKCHIVTHTPLSSRLDCE